MSPVPPVTRRKQFQNLVIFAAIPLALLTLFVWWSYSKYNERWLESMDLEKFNETQLAVWKNCDALYAQWGKVHERLEEFGDANANAAFERTKDLSEPATCKLLSEQRALLRRQKAGKN